MAALPLVLAEARATAILAYVALPTVHADARATAILAFVAPPTVHADARAATILALMAPPLVLADARTAAHLALLATPMLAFVPATIARRALCSVCTFFMQIHPLLCEPPFSVRPGSRLQLAGQAPNRRVAPDLTLRMRENLPLLDCVEQISTRNFRHRLTALVV